MKLEDLEKARLAQKQSDRHVYFDDIGNICYYGRTDSSDYLEYNHAVFTYDQCSIFEDEKSNKIINDYLVLVNPNEEGVYTFVTKVVELEKFKSATKMLTQVRLTENTEFDIKIHTVKNTMTVSLSDKLRTNITKNVDVNNFTFKGEQRIALYVTSLNDPHFLFDSIEILLQDLITNEQLVFDLNNDCTNKSIYTRKLFEKYIRVA